MNKMKTILVMILLLLAGAVITMASDNSFNWVRPVGYGNASFNITNNYYNGTSYWNIDNYTLINADGIYQVNQTWLNDTIDARATAGNDSVWNIDNLTLYNDSSVLKVNQSAITQGFINCSGNATFCENITYLNRYNDGDLWFDMADDNFIFLNGLNENHTNGIPLDIRTKIYGVTRKNVYVETRQMSDNDDVYGIYNYFKPYANSSLGANYSVGAYRADVVNTAADGLKNYYGYYAYFFDFTIGKNTSDYAYYAKGDWDYALYALKGDIYTNDNVSANYFIGNGSLLTDVIGGNSTDTVWNIDNVTLINNTDILQVNESWLNDSLTAFNFIDETKLALDFSNSPSNLSRGETWNITNDEGNLIMQLFSNSSLTIIDPDIYIDGVVYYGNYYNSTDSFFNYDYLDFGMGDITAIVGDLTYFNTFSLNHNDNIDTLYDTQISIATYQEDGELSDNIVELSYEKGISIGNPDTDEANGRYFSIWKGDGDSDFVTGTKFMVSGHTGGFLAKNNSAIGNVATSINPYVGLQVNQNYTENHTSTGLGFQINYEPDVDSIGSYANGIYGLTSVTGSNNVSLIAGSSNIAQHYGTANIWQGIGSYSAVSVLGNGTMSQASGQFIGNNNIADLSTINLSVGTMYQEQMNGTNNYDIWLQNGANIVFRDYNKRIESGSGNSLDIYSNNWTNVNSKVNFTDEIYFDSLATGTGNNVYWNDTTGQLVQSSPICPSLYIWIDGQVCYNEKNPDIEIVAPLILPNGTMVVSSYNTSGGYTKICNDTLVKKYQGGILEALFMREIEDIDTLSISQPFYKINIVEDKPEISYFKYFKLSLNGEIFESESVEGDVNFNGVYYILNRGDEINITFPVAMNENDEIMFITEGFYDITEDADGWYKYMRIMKENAVDKINRMELDIAELQTNITDIYNQIDVIAQGGIG